MSPSVFDEAPTNFHRFWPLQTFRCFERDRRLPVVPTNKILNRRLQGKTCSLLQCFGSAKRTTPGRTPALLTERWVRDWFKGGGSLLLIADQTMDSANQLRLPFGVDMIKVPVDPQIGSANPGFIFTRARVDVGTTNTRGRNSGEQVKGEAFTDIMEMTTYIVSL